MPENGLIFLKDVSERDKPWDEHRANASEVGMIYTFDGTGEFDRLAQRMGDCSKLLEMVLRAGEEGDLHFKLSHTRFCRVRHCPVCQWRRALMWTARMIKALPKIQSDHPDHRWIFLTFTVQNPLIKDLRDSITDMNKGFSRMTKRKLWPCLGWIKSTEVTMPKASKLYAHPHFHVLGMVSPSYFNGRSYIKHTKWISFWRDCMKLEYDPTVYVKAVKPKGEGKFDLDKAIVETLKYSVKEDDLVKDAQWLFELTRQMHNVRSVSIGGCFRQYFSENEPEDLINVDDLPDGQETNDPHLFFPWDAEYRRYRLRD